MDWREVTIYTTTEGIGPVEALLEDNGVEGYVLEDAADFEEFLKDTEIYWDYVDEDLVREKRAQETCLKIYLPDSDEGAKQYADIRAALENLKARDEEHAWGRLCTETALTRQEDWEWGWKQYFKPFPVGRGFMIKPSWETVEDPQGRRILEIDPASSFGTGSHDTTQLCMMALEDAVKPGGKLLDKRAVFRKRRGHQDGLIVFTHNDAEFSGLRFCKAAEIQLRANVLRQRENQLLCGRGFLQGPGKNRRQQLLVSAFPHIGCRTRQCARDRLRAFAGPLVDGAPQMLHLYVAIWQIERRFDGKTECCVTGISPAAAELHDG